MIFVYTARIESVRLLLALTATSAVALLCEASFPGSWTARAGLFAGCCAVTAVMGRNGILHRSSDHHFVNCYIESLCRLSHHDLADPQVVESLPTLPEQSPWTPLLTRMRDRLVECGQRTDEAEHSSTACEVRHRRLEKEHAQLRDILDRVAEPVLAVNHYGELMWFNQAAQELLEIERTEDGGAATLACRPLVDLLNEARRRKNSALRNGELELDTPAGKRWYRVAVRSMQEGDGDSGKQQGAVAALVDISAEKGIQQRHAEFVSSAAHELKTPLASVRAYVELLQDNAAEDDATREEFLNVIATQTERLQRLIENLLNLARIEAGVVKVEKHDRSLNELLENAFEVVQPTAEQKPLEISRDLSPLHLQVFVDRDMMLQAAINLLSNAIKYTPAGGKVVLRSRIDDNAAVFEVEDTGVGLSPEDCQKVFERFYRVRKDQQMAPGTGLGLSLVKHIVEDVHGGAVTVTSEAGKGSIFRVTLPTVSRSRG